ncbi:hypothetical protein O181_014069 [Austropuccinia psidii MF-1]|uniref:NADH dehydrogenase [ubiquinone] 1 alpha subcomplex assembly factor 3 n=1 Tax=Austropuccinia psidii MF-1 TaxID=1389203 RepID=A0A9Q3GPH8_9BASI|nr:hypothetical protein [Austropuccinia psidii MF-1]
MNLASLRSISKSTSITRFQVSHHPSKSYQQRSSSQLSNIILPPDPNHLLQIHTLTHRTFTLSNSVVVASNLFLYRSTALLWNPLYLNVINPQNHPSNEQSRFDFKILEILNPRPEMLIFGTGESNQSIHPMETKRIKDYLSSIGVQLDVLDTKNACSNYNLLIEEGRSIAAMFLTLQPVNSVTSQLIKYSPATRSF